MSEMDFQDEMREALEAHEALTPDQRRDPCVTLTIYKDVGSDGCGAFVVYRGKEMLLDSDVGMGDNVAAAAEVARAFVGSVFRDPGFWDFPGEPADIDFECAYDLGDKATEPGYDSFLAPTDRETLRVLRWKTERMVWVQDPEGTRAASRSFPHPGPGKY